MLQASHSPEPHPILCGGSVLVDTEKADEQPQESEDEGADEVTGLLGTLSVYDQGHSRFFGFTGGSDLLLVRYALYNSPLLPLLPFFFLFTLSFR